MQNDTGTSAAAITANEYDNILANNNNNVPVETNLSSSSSLVSNASTPLLVDEMSRGSLFGDNDDDPANVIADTAIAVRPRLAVWMNRTIRIFCPWLGIGNERAVEETGSNNYRNDSCGSVLLGILTLIAFGCLLGFLSNTVVSDGHNYETKSWESLTSSCIGYTYFIMWSISFYPQCILNVQRQTTTGLSVDFAWYNVIGFACYATYNLSLFYNPSVRQQYFRRHPESHSIPIRSNDVAFALHALLFSAITLVQIGYYDGASKLVPSPRSCAVIGLTITCIVCYPILLVVLPLHYSSLDYVYWLSYIKISITCIKYVPQVVLNMQRQSTTGWNIWQILFDASGGIFSIIQLLFDCYFIAHDWSGLTGNLPKFMLGNISICFDILFILQHYILYPSTHPFTNGYRRANTASIDIDVSEEMFVEHPVSTTLTCP
jgi:cystinosin